MILDVHTYLISTSFAIHLDNKTKTLSNKCL